MGLGGLIVDVSRFLAFVTSGRILKYQIKGHEFKHFKYNSRSWGIISKHEQLCLVNAYPADKLQMKDRLREAGYRVMNHSDSFSQSLINHEIPRHQDGSESTIYLDSVGISCRNEDKRKTKRTWYYTDDGTTGSLSEFDYDGTFENVSSFEDLMHELRSCDYCGERYHEDNGFYPENGGGICSYCYDEHHFTCRHCRGVFNNDQAEQEGGLTYCTYCHNSQFKRCHDCEDIFRANDTYHVGGFYFCQKCYDNKYFGCVHCGNDVPHDECGPTDYEGYCRHCYNRLFEECTNCQVIEEGHLLTDYGDERLCWSCIEKKQKGEGE